MVRLLVIHDDTGDRETVAEVARAANIDRNQFRTPKSWEEAWEATGGNEVFDLAVIDIGLWDRKRGGIDLIGRLHERQPECKILALTALEPESGVRAMQEGAVDFIYTGWDGIPWPRLLEERLKLFKTLVEQGKGKKNTDPTRKEPSSV